MLASTMSSCSDFTLKRKKCHDLYGKLGEDCLVAELQEKRCLSFQHCSKEATAYYGTKDGRKGLCASWAEAFCFADPSKLMERQEMGHHEKARELVNDANNRHVKAECRSIAMDLAKCMKKYTH